MRRIAMYADPSRARDAWRMALGVLAGLDCAWSRRVLRGGMGAALWLSVAAAALAVVRGVLATWLAWSCSGLCFVLVGRKKP